MLKLDESLFDDDISFTFDDDNLDSYKSDDYDDDLFEIVPEEGASTDHEGNVVPEGPEAGIESGIADALIKLINDEWEAIQGYNNFRDMILSMQQSGDGDYSEMIRVIDEVSNEENLHVGQLQELLKRVSPNTESIARGEEEAEEQLASSGNEWVNGQLKVEFHEPTVSSTAGNEPEYNKIDNSCSILDADDEW